jgi:hypothetical protein
MSGQTKSATRVKSLTTPFGIWLVAILLVFTFPHPFPAFTGLGMLVFPLAGFLLMLFYLYTLFRWKYELLSLLFIILIGLVSVLTFQRGITWGAMARFYLNRSKYEAAVVNVISAEDEAQKEERCSGDCWILSKEANQIGFHYAHGFLNWHDIVYDPTKEVDKVKTVGERYKISIYFIGAEHITGNWYVCHFAD